MNVMYFEEVCSSRPIGVWWWPTFTVPSDVFVEPQGSNLPVSYCASGLRHWDTAVELIRPQGGIVSIDDTHLPMPMEGMKMKAASFHWEFMFARAMHQTPDMIEQHHLLTWTAGEIDAGRIRTTLSETLSPINAANLREAHRRIETGQARGKIVVEGF